MAQEAIDFKEIRFVTIKKKHSEDFEKSLPFWKASVK